MRNIRIRYLALLLGFTLLAVPLFSACQAAEDEEVAELGDLYTDEDYYTRFQNDRISINVYNWGEYLSDGGDGTLNINAEFRDLTGINVNYSTYATNEELYSKLKGGAASYDVIIPSDYMIGRMISEDMLEPLDLDNIPNFELTDEDFLNPIYDEANRYSVPYMWGITGIIYNTNRVNEPVDSWDILWDEAYAGQILMFSNPRDAFAIAQKTLGYSMNSTDPYELQRSLDKLKAQKPLVQAYVMDEIFDKMLGGEATLAPYYAGDAVTMIDQNPELAFAAPKEGVNIFVDAACIPKGSRQKQAAEMYINFLCEPEVSAANADYIGYATPNSEALDLLDEEVTSDPVAYPDEEIIEGAEYFNELPRETSLLMDRLWTELLTDDESYSRLLVPIFLLVAVALIVAINVYRMTIRKKKQKYYF